MFWEDIFFLFSSGGTPEWSPCVGIGAGGGEKMGNEFSPESLSAADAFVVNKG